MQSVLLHVFHMKLFLNIISKLFPVGFLILIVHSLIFLSSLVSVAMTVGRSQRSALPETAQEDLCRGCRSHKREFMTFAVEKKIRTTQSETELEFIRKRF